MTTANAKMNQRSDTAANWTSEDPILGDGEIGWEKDTKKFKVGDGTTTWTSLDYFTPASNPYGQTIYGDGSDGVVDLDGTNLYPWCSLDGANSYTMARDVYATDLTVQSGVTVKSRYRIFATGTLDNQGTIHCNGGNASGATVGSLAPSNYFSGGTAAGAGIVSGGAAADGTAGTSSSSRLVGGIGGRGAGAWASGILRRGKGSATLSSEYWGNLNGGVAVLRNIITYLAKRLIGGASVWYQLESALGGGGGAKAATGTSCNSGAGGGPGGWVVIFARIIINSGTISSNGGKGGDAGGTGANSGGGGGGGGGIVALAYDELTNTGTISADPGAGGASVALGTTPTKAMAIVVASAGALSTSQAGLANSMVTVVPATAGIGAANDTLYLLAISQAGGTLQDPVVEGWGLTWTKIGHVDWDTIATPTKRFSLYYAYGTAQIDGEGFGANSIGVTCTFGTTVPTTCDCSIFEIQNAPSTIVQSATNRKDFGGAANLTVTLGAVGSANAACIGVFTTSAAISAGTGFALINDYSGSALHVMGEIGYNDVTVDATFGVSVAAAAGIAIEVAAIGAMEDGKAGHAGRVMHFVNKG